MDTEIKKVLIIGSGPAGLTAGLYAARANLNPLVVDGPNPGGQLVWTSDVENWPGEKKILGLQLVNNIREHAQHYGCEFISGSVTDIDSSKQPFTVTVGEKKIKTQTIIIATGAKPRKLGVPGENTYWGKGVSTCAICDGAFFKDKKIIIVGGGDTAMEHASFMSKFTDQITIVHILDSLTASAPMQKRILENKNIDIIYNSSVAEIIGNGQLVREAVIKNKKTGKQHNMLVDGLFLAIGLIPNTNFLQGKVKLDKWGYIKVEQKHGQTSCSTEGIFAAGDVYDYVYKQAITASGMGCMAALDAERYLNTKTKK